MPDGAPQLADWMKQHPALRLNGPLFLGETLSAADFYLVMLTGWAAPWPIRPDRGPIRKTAQHGQRSPAVCRAYAREGVMGEIC
jgi:glutathione S-transferase